MCRSQIARAHSASGDRGQRRPPATAAYRAKYPLRREATPLSRRSARGQKTPPSLTLQSDFAKVVHAKIKQSKTVFAIATNHKQIDVKLLSCH